MVFTTSREQLEDFEKQFPQLEQTIKGLLRSYEGIFDYPGNINENELAKFLRKPKNAIKQDLLLIQQYGIIQYSPQKDTPQLTLLLNRMYADSFVIDLKNYVERKKNFETRITAIVQYITNTTLCRSKIIAKYFNDLNLKACGICDNCIHQKSVAVSREEFEVIANYINGFIYKKSGDIKALMSDSKHLKKEKLWKVIEYLQAEKKLMLDKDGNMIR